MTEPSQRPPVASSPISLILLAQALSTEAADALQAWHTYLQTLRRPFEIFVIQETRPEVEAAELAKGAVRFFPYARSAGHREAWNDAIRASRHPLLVFCPCDKQYQPADLEKLLGVIDQVDLAVGFRAGGQAPLWRVVLDLIGSLFSRVILGIPAMPRVCWLGSEGRFRRWVARWIFGVRVYDPECPFRLVRREVFEHLPIQSRGSFVHVEVLAKANHLSCLLTQEPLTWTPPSLPASDEFPFGQEAMLLFQAPDFGPPPSAAPGPPADTPPAPAET